MAGTVIMLAVAGLLEGIGRQTIIDDLRRYLIGVADAGRLARLFLPAGRHGGRAMANEPGRQQSLQRSFVTPEGVDLKLELGLGRRPRRRPSCSTR